MPWGQSIIYFIYISVVVTVACFLCGVFCYLTLDIRLLDTEISAKQEFFSKEQLKILILSMLEVEKRTHLTFM